jgi:ABC-type spermidine/putrescine transport system permease subunit II
MSLENLALLVGFFVVPALLLAIGHRLRRRPPFWRRVFWGGVIGHSIAILVMLVVTMTPPIAWEGGPRLRDAAVHWSMVLGAVIGGVIGAALPARKRRG